MTANGSVVLAIDVGGSSIKAALIGEDGSALGSQSVPVRMGEPEETVNNVIGVAGALMGTGGQPGPVAVGLVVPGIVDEDAGVARSSMLLGWRDVPFVDLLRRETGLEVGFGHDVVGGALAEGAFGAARGIRHWLFLALGTGLGSSFVIDGTPYRGAHGYGGELAHVVVVPDGVLCRCGKRGCAEMYFCGSALVDRVAERWGRRPESAATAIDAARAGDADAIAVWSQGIEALAAAVAVQAEMFDPELVVVGGGISEAGSFLLEPLRDRVSAQVKFVPLAPIVPAVLGDRAGLMGAAVLARDAAVRRRVAAPTATTN